ncbi:fibronectin-binding autotransporter adhesin [Terrimicrobium sacchariphilum]|uniref:Fibronectin-binding autotransporter adhesin n=1 Tax=Terrimicrobium sacchariphilum TaxID=690879 RepID=A0A146GEP1_TERSA|nr:autotransporter-associated beta strand repeat-containing protein [Terrimicrobium sacchariphilum]GAT35573.1 fibronectin-binding autotransporter adhesin [Terrimicrobium sacchariphilum]
MKSPFASSPAIYRSACVAFSLLGLSLTNSPAISLTWDPSGNQSGVGGTGTWDTTNSQWLSAGVDSTWPGAGNTAVFKDAVSTGSYTVSVQGGGVTSGGLDFQNGGTSTVTLNGGAVTFSNGGSGVTVKNSTNASSNAIINSVLTGNESVSFAANYNLTLGAANTYTGATRVTAGNLRIGVDNALPTDTALTMAGGNILMGGKNLTVASLAGTNSSNVIRNLTNNSTSTLTVNGSSSTSYSGNLNNGNSATQILALTKSGTSTLTLSNTASTYSGATTINGGILSISTLANGGANSSIGAASSLASNLILNGGTLRYTGAAISTDRLFSVGANGGTLDASGSGAVTFSGTSAIGYNGQSGERTLTLTGSSAGDNSLSVVIGDNGGATSLAKTGTGKWILGGVNTYTGNTVVSSGTLVLADNAGMTFAIGSNGVSNQINGTGTLALNGDFTFDLTSAAIADGNSWTIVTTGTLDETFGSTFTVNGFTENANVWTMSSGNNTWTFAENTGVLSLSVVPEPGSVTLALAGLGLLFLVQRLTRRHVSFLS